MGTTTGGLPYPEPTDAVAGGADAIKALALAIESQRGIRAITAISAGATGLASGATAGFTATLPTVKVGWLVVGIVQHNGANTVATTAFMGATATGFGGHNGPGASFTTVAGAGWQGLWIGVGVATGGNCTLTYTLTMSGGGTWSVNGSRASIILIALPANGALGLLLAALAAGDIGTEVGWTEELTLPDEEPAT